MCKPILDIDNISKSFFTKVKTDKYDSYEEEHVLLRNFSLEIPQNKVTCLIGGNGTGKTTLFNLINGFLKPDAGSIFYHGNAKSMDLTKIAAHKIPHIGIGRLFQDNHIFENLTLAENLALASENRSGENPWQAVFQKNKYTHNQKENIILAERRLNELFGSDNKFWNLRNEFAGSLSFGEKRLLGLARLMMGEYKLVLLDEPTSGVNPVLFDSIANIIHVMISKGITVFMIEHNMPFVKTIADRCAFVDHGKVDTVGTAKEILENENVKMTYLGT